MKTAFLAEIMTANSFGEVMFLVAFILFAIELLAIVTRARPNPPAWALANLAMVAGFACVALGWLALTTGD